MNKSLYSQLQNKADIEPIQITPSEQNSEDDQVDNRVQRRAGRHFEDNDENSAENSKNSDSSPIKQS